MITVTNIRFNCLIQNYVIFFVNCWEIFVISIIGSSERSVSCGAAQKNGEPSLPHPPYFFLLAVFRVAPQLTERLQEATSSDDVAVVTSCV